MTSFFKASLLLILIVLIGCTPQGTITNFDGFNYQLKMNETVYIYGTALEYPLMTTKHYSSFYGLEDSEGFRIMFVPRGGRHIHIGDTYLIKGIVSSDDESICLGECHKEYFILEVSETNTLLKNTTPNNTHIPETHCNSTYTSQRATSSGWELCCEENKKTICVPIT